MNLFTVALGVAAYFSVVLFALAIERIAPVEQHTTPGIRLNFCITGLNYLLHIALGPLIAMLTVAVVNAAGGGWIVLPNGGWGLLAGLAAYAFLADALEYWFHRAQHRWPLLWAMHSLHHSDPELNATSTGRHFWADHLLKLLTIYLLVGIVFKANPAIIGLYLVMSFYNVFSHMNLRVGFGRMAFLLNSPQYHRVHHSALPEHYNRNYAALFPIFDVLFGTYYPPRTGEFPATGLSDRRPPAGPLQALLWPAVDRHNGDSQSG
jgi:sterol desaturase/sphingolipid hydroxylase (fatty acid hydroxylase superfamily)